MLVKERGFSIIELMVVVAIVAILAGIAAPSFQSILATSRIKTLAADIHLSMTRARSEAIKRNSNITLEATEGNWLAGWTISNGIETHQATTGSNLSVAGNATITYTPNGRTTASPISISVTSTDTSVARCVSVSLSGQPIINGSACP